MLNDTFDDFTFSDLQIDLSISPITNQLNNTKLSPGTSSIIKNDISFDDSFFINSLNSPQLEENQQQPLPLNSDCNISLPTSQIKEPSPPTSEQCKLSTWGLPTAILEKYHRHHITTMFPWQVDCLNSPHVLKKQKNLIYSAPTSAGKTLVAEILSIKTVLEREKKVIFILPFVSVVREKMFYFQDLFGDSGVRVDGFMGSYNPPGGFHSVQLAVCTIEKANNIINKLLQEGKMMDIGAVVIDEMHLLGDPGRGYLLELLLTKLKYICVRDPQVNIQIIGMSATLPNLGELAKWLDAALYVTTFRPIPLHEQAHVDGDIYDTHWQLIRHLDPTPDLDTDTDNILQLCLETIREGCSVLIFCPTKNWCENLATQISTAFCKLGHSKTPLGQQLRQQLNADLILELLEQLKYCPVGLDGVLRKTVSFGVAFHHAGLTLDERDIVEEAFRAGVIRVLVATSTLSSGVNLPAKRVIIRTPIFHGKPLDPLAYKQMVGRAGRMGKDTSGESVLVCQRSDTKTAQVLMQGHLQPIESCLEGGGKLARALLEVVASGVCRYTEDVDLFTKSTLLAQNNKLEHPVEEVVHFLTANELIRVQKQDTRSMYVATNLGKACLTSSVSPEDGLALYTELEKARQCFVLETELHLIYLVTPYSACHQWGTIDWMFYLNTWEKLSPSMKRVGDLVGVRETYLVNATRGRLQTNTAKLHHKLLVHKRFLVALALQDLVNEQPLNSVCAKFHCNRGLLQSLQLSAATFAGMVAAFAKQLGWKNVEMLIGQFQDRLHFGVGRDLLDLMRLPILNGRSARALFDAGLETLVQVANSDVHLIEDVLHKVMPFESEKMRDGESEFDMRQRNSMRNIWITGKQGLTERQAAELLLTGARDFLRMELGLKEAKWCSNNDSGVKDSPCSLDEEKLAEDSSSDLISTSQDDNWMATPKRKGTFLGQSPRNKKAKFDLTHKSMPINRNRHIFYNPVDTHFKDSLGQIEVIDVCHCDTLYATFCKEVKLQGCISLSVACGGEKQRQVLGFAIFWGGTTAYYLDTMKIPHCTDIIATLVTNKDLTVHSFDCKEQIKVLKRCCNINLMCKVEDPKIGDWILQPEGKEKNLTAMVLAHCPRMLQMSQLCGGSGDNGSPALDIGNSVEARVRSSIESVVTWHLSQTITDRLQSQFPHLSKFYATEMTMLRILAQMEVVGVGIRPQTLSELLNTLNTEKVNLEKKAFNLAGHRFSLSSSKDLARVLGRHGNNPISSVVAEWRKLTSILTRTVQPLIRYGHHHHHQGRIHGCFVVHTATGRITMHEPNLQNVARDFLVANGQVVVSCRRAFVPCKGCVFISADYCQLELRLLAHLSGDVVLRRIMAGKGDIFRSIAAKLNKIEEREVTDDLRQHSKQICYGIVYGLGMKSLSEQLGVDEGTACAFMESFKNAYPSVMNYVADVVKTCRENGFVETLTGRRRYLPHINHQNPVMKSQAERQAVNTTIQGSAADIVKRAMVELDKKCEEMRRDRPTLVLHLHDELLYEVPEGSVGAFAPVLKRTMEGCVNLSIPFPVKLKTGPSWGQLTEYSM